MRKRFRYQRKRAVEIKVRPHCTLNTRDFAQADTIRADLLGARHPAYGLQRPGDRGAAHEVGSETMSEIIDHLGLSVTDFDAALKFYSAALGTLGIKALANFEYEGERHAGFGITKPDFWIGTSRNRTGGFHIAFIARSRAEVIAYHSAAQRPAGATMAAGPARRVFGQLFRRLRVRSGRQQYRSGLPCPSLTARSPVVASAAPCAMRFQAASAGWRPCMPLPHVPEGRCRTLRGDLPGAQDRFHHHARRNEPFLELGRGPPRLFAGIAVRR